jgi:hypothetical protein
MGVTLILLTESKFTLLTFVWGQYVPIRYDTVCFIPVQYIPIHYFLTFLTSPYVSSLKESQPSELHQPKEWWGI